MTFPEQLRTLTVNSLVETNLGLPALYLIYLALSTRITEDLKSCRFTLKEMIRKNNTLKSGIKGAFFETGSNDQELQLSQQIERKEK